MASPEQLRVGVVGVGTIAAALVEAVLAHPQGAALEIVLSPRSPSRSAALASRHPQVRVAVDNQAVLDACDLVLLAVLPKQLPAVCAGLRFRIDHVVASVAAGWPPSAVAPLVTPAEQVCQLIPLPMIRLHRGPIVAYPDLAPVRSLLAGCGDWIVPADEQQLAVLGAASATMSTFFALQLELSDWMQEQGIHTESAERYVAALFHGLASESAMAPEELASQVAEHETPGGLNEQVRTALKRAGAFSALSEELTHLLLHRLAT